MVGSRENAELECGAGDGDPAEHESRVLAVARALNYFAYNFIRIHGTLRTSPAMADGVTNKLWEVSDLVALWEEYERRGKERHNG